MDPHLKQLQQTLQAATDGLSEAQLTWHPEGKWCVAEVLEHLYLTYTGTIKGFERVLAAGKSIAKPRTLADRGRAFVVVGLGYLPSGRQAPAVARPTGLPREKVLAEIVPKIAEMDEIIRRCERRMGASTKLDHPILGPLSVRQWRKFHLVHGRHHAKQIYKLRASAQ